MEDNNERTEIYTLLKDLPGVKAGTVGHFYLDNGIAKIYTFGRYEFTDSQMIKNPEWFGVKRNLLRKYFIDFIQEYDKSGCLTKVEIDVLEKFIKYLIKTNRLGGWDKYMEDK